MSGYISGFKMSEYKKFLNWEKPKAFYSWFNIILFGVFILPLGAYAYWKRSKIDKTMSLHTWKIFVAFGLMIAITGARIFIASGGAFFNILIGLALMVAGFFMRKTAFTRMDIIGALLVKREFNVRNISLAINKSEKVVHNELDNMIKKGMLPGVIVNYEANEVYVPGYSGDGMEEYVSRVYSDAAGIKEEDREEAPVFKTQEEAEAYSDLKRANNIKNHPLYTGICASCGEKMTEEAIKAKKCQVCGREYEAPEEDEHYF